MSILSGIIRGWSVAAQPPVPDGEAAAEKAPAETGPAGDEPAAGIILEGGLRYEPLNWLRRPPCTCDEGPETIWPHALRLGLDFGDYCFTLTPDGFMDLVGERLRAGEITGMEAQEFMDRFEGFYLKIKDDRKISRKEIADIIDRAIERYKTSGNRHKGLSMAVAVEEAIEEFEGLEEPECKEPLFPWFHFPERRVEPEWRIGPWRIELGLQWHFGPEVKTERWPFLRFDRDF